MSDLLCVLQHMRDTNQYVQAEMDALEYEQAQVDERAAQVETQLRRVMDKGVLAFSVSAVIHEAGTGRKEGNVLFNDALNTFYLRLYGVTHMVKDHSDSKREETRCRHMGYSFRLAAMVLLYASSHRQDNTYHGLCYTSRGALAGTRNSSMGPP